MNYSENYKGEELQDNGDTISVIQLVQSMEAGEIIREKDIIQVRIPENNQKENIFQKSKIIGNRLKLSLSENTILTSEMVYMGEAISEDLRLHYFPFVQLTEKLQKGDFIDIRISFLNGVDFVLLSKKKIEDISIQDGIEGTSKGVWIEVTEEEILRLSSALVDNYLNEESVIYGIEYVLETQKAAIVNYPVNKVVERLIEEDPNIVAKAEKHIISNLRNDIEVPLERDDGNGTFDNSIHGKDGEVENYELPPSDVDAIEYFD